MKKEQDEKNTKEIEENYRTSEIELTDHAFDRLKERFGLKKTTLMKIAIDAIKYGEFHTNSPLEIYKKTKSVSFIRKNKIFVFREKTIIETEKKIALITIYPFEKNTSIEEKFKEFNKGREQITRNDQRKKEKYKVADAHRKSKKHKNEINNY